MRRDVEFDSSGTKCRAWHFRATGNELAGDRGRPCVVMGPGLAATRDSGLDAYGDRLAAAGADVLLFDYRGFGASEGEPRQLIDLAGQRADYHAAIGYAHTLDGVDPGRIVVWGHSLAGCHVLQVGAEDQRIAAVIAVAPAVDARAFIAFTIVRSGIRTAARVLGAGVRDAIAALSSRPPVTIPIVGAPGSPAVFTSPHPRRGYISTAGGLWRNEVAARITLTVVPARRALHQAGRLSCPTLVQVADDDTMASPQLAMQAAWHARADVRHYPCDHLDVLAGQPWFEPAAAHQVHFMRRCFAAVASAATSSPPDDR